MHHDNSVHAKAIHLFGAQHQEGKVAEEMLEFLEARQKFLNAQNRRAPLGELETLYSHMVDECADVLFTIQYLPLIFNKEMLDRLVREREKALLKQIEGASYGT